MAAPLLQAQIDIEAPVSTVVEMIPEQRPAFRVNANNTIWSYELTPISDGTRVIESRIRAAPENG
jgi:hypothetical protein